MMTFNNGALPVELTENELQLLADFRKLNAEAQAFVAENVHHLATLEKYAK